MFSARSVFPPALLLAAALVSACEDGSLTAPSPPPPTPSPTPDLSPLLGVWNLTVRLQSVTGDGCAAEEMQSHIGVPNRYSLRIEQASGSTVEVTLSSESGNYSCTLLNVPADSSWFTTLGRHGRFVSCVGLVVRPDFRCGDGTLDLISWGEDVSARVSGAEITGQWVAAFGDGPVYQETTWAETRAEFSGSR